MQLDSKVSHQVRVFDAFKNLQLICGFFDSFVIVRLESDLVDPKKHVSIAADFDCSERLLDLTGIHTSFMAISSPVSTLMQVYTFPYWPSPVVIIISVLMSGH